MKLQIINAISDRSNQDCRKALHHLSRLGVDVHIQMGMPSMEYSTIMFEGHDPNPEHAAEVSLTIDEIGRHLLHPVIVKYEYAGEAREYFIGPNAAGLTRQVMLQKAAFYALQAGDTQLASMLRSKATH